MDPTQRYFDLIQRIDANAKRLTTLHGGAITCRPGCTTCCVNLTVFPVELHAIQLAITRAGVTLDTGAFDPSATCGFLHNDLCRIYPFRPIICRTHGLPILFLDDRSEPTWEVSFCELNFKENERLEFTDDSLLNIEDINTELARINLDFSTMGHKGGGKHPTRIPLSALCAIKT